MIRPEVVRIIELGPLPGEDDERPEDALTALLNVYEKCFDTLIEPATDEEALVLLNVFNPDKEDSCFGLAWALVHFIETAPNWPGDPALTPTGRAIEAQLQDSAEPWKQTLWQRILNWREHHRDDTPVPQS